MSDALPLPPRPRLERYRKTAKDLLKAANSRDPAALQSWAAQWLESLARARDMDARDPEVRGLIEGGTQWLARTWSQVRAKRRSAATLADAQFLIARAHGFESWPKFANHLKAQERAEGSPFEQAADAIVNGDIHALLSLLQAHPGLISERSEREHHSTLLHYVSANGVEDFRQKTPPNIVEITRLLLDRGAQVNAESDAYKGRSTVLELAATSVHPEATGVQIELMTLLLDRGAAVDGVRGDSIVNACLANGRGQAAAWLAERGARLDLEGAAGVGRLDLVKGFFEQQGALRPEATRQQMLDGFTRACEFGHAAVVTFLLENGVDVAQRLRRGETGLHWAAYEGHAGIVEMLLGRGAPLNVRDQSFDGTPLDWALHGWAHIGRHLMAGRRHTESVAALIRAGAVLDRRQYEGQSGLLEKARADDHMRAALEGRIPSP